MTIDELASNASTLIIAGSETTATALSAATYFLATTPPALAKLTDEVRSTFATEDEIDLTSVQRLTYMLAVLDETLRLYPPVPSGSPRKISDGGETLAGQFVPPGVSRIAEWDIRCLGVPFF